MKYFEIFLKLAFLVLSIYIIVSKNVMSHWFMALLVVALLLGITLIFNKKMSYNYPANWPRLNRVYLTRRIEGVLLVVCSVAMLIFIHLN